MPATSQLHSFVHLTIISSLSGKLVCFYTNPKKLSMEWSLHLNSWCSLPPLAANHHCVPGLRPCGSHLSLMGLPERMFQAVGSENTKAARQVKHVPKDKAASCNFEVIFSSLRTKMSSVNEGSRPANLSISLMTQHWCFPCELVVFDHLCCCDKMSYTRSYKGEKLYGKW